MTFNNGAAGTVTAATSTQLTVTFASPPTSTGSLTVVVTSFGGFSGFPVQVATVVLATQATLVVVPTPSSINVNGSSSLSTTGGSGSGAVSYNLVSGPCTLSGATLTGTGAGSCIVTATKAADSTYASATSSPVSITVSLAPQTALTVVASSTSINVNGTATLSTTGGNGNGAVTYAVTGPCSLNGLTLTGTGAGNCSVTATKAADTVYDSVTSSPVDITVSGPPPVLNLVATPGPGYIRLDFSTATSSIAVSTSQARTNSVVTFTGTCVSTNGGVTASSTGTSSPLRVTGVTAGKTYTCTVTGTDGSGSSTSAPSNAVMPAPAPPPVNPIPTLSEWAQIMMMLAMIATAGFYGWRMKQR